MSRRAGAPYADRVEDEGRTLIYEGHDVPHTRRGPDPKTVDQPRCNPSGTLTQNGLFERAVQEFKQGKADAELVRVYEKIREGIWVLNGLFRLVDCWEEKSGARTVFKFKMEILEAPKPTQHGAHRDSDQDRVIPSWVKLDVWKRDKGACRICGSITNLHFDHIIPYSRGGSSKDPKNIQILCGKHNIAKRDRIE
jgi:hypothetical protein